MGVTIDVKPCGVTGYALSRPEIALVGGAGGYVTIVSQNEHWHVIVYVPVSRATCRLQCRMAYKGAVYRTARWLRLSALMRSRNPVCQLCGCKPSECVDHVDNDTANWAEDNFRALCWSCHSWKTQTPYTAWILVVQAFKQEMYED